MDIMITSLLSLLLAFAISALLGPVTIPMLKRLHFGQNVRTDGPQTHLKKQGTPTMGGIMILIAVLIATLVFGGSKGYTLPVTALLMSVLFGLLGFADDFIKIVRKRSLGLRAWQKIAGQFILSLGFAIWLYFMPDVGSTLWLDRLDIGVSYIPFAMFVIIAIVNSVNLTDGLDGLSSSVTAIYSIATAILCCLFCFQMSKTVDPTEALLKSIDNMTGMSVFSCAVAGACIGFLVHNTFPAKVFMGDAGAFTLGGAVSAMALLTRTSLLMPLMGICFVASSVSVILQVGSYKLRNKKRVFRMAPLHHHFEQGGAPETKIVSMYSIVTVLSSAVALLIFWLAK